MADPFNSKEAETPMISAPASASPIAIAIPIPFLHPVTSATLPLKLNVCCILFIWSNKPITLLFYSCLFLNHLNYLSGIFQCLKSDHPRFSIPFDRRIRTIISWIGYKRFLQISFSILNN